MRLLRTDGTLIHEGDFDSIKELVEYCVREGISLERADLRWANLRGADLGFANFREADFRKANFEWADLRFANFEGANLYEADFEGANFEGSIRT